MTRKSVEKVNVRPESARSGDYIYRDCWFPETGPEGVNDMNGMKNGKSYRWVCGGCLLAAVLASGCSPENELDKGEGTVGVGGPGGWGGQTGPVSGSGGTVPLEPQAGTEGQWHPPEADAALDGACQAVTSTGENVETLVPYEVTEVSPIAIYIMLDATMSMVGVSLVAMDGIDKWTPAINAIDQFINDPQSAGLDVALEVFPLDPNDPQAGVIALGDCSGTGYNDPAVPMGPLPDNAAAISSFLSNVTPAGMGTPMEGAVNGATQFCANFKQDTTANPEGEDCVVVLVTDGTPENAVVMCPTLDINVISDTAGAAYTNNGVRTFPIGMTGADFTFLNMVGEKSNADCTPDDDATWACDVSQTGGAGLVEALNGIRETVTHMETRTEMRSQIVDCEWVIPEMAPGQLFNPDKVNFQFTTGVDQPVERLIKRVDSEEQCQPGVEAWYYDNLEEPTKILVCPDTCETIQAEEQARIDILLGCDTLKID